MKRLFLYALLILVLLPLSSFAETPEEKGLKIAIEADRRDDGFGDYRTDLVMVLRNRNGDESRREMKTRNLEAAGDGDKSLSLFQTPRDVKGTAFLSFSHKSGLDDQWLYLPALKRVKRISSSNKSGSFMGSEFAYEDIASNEIEKYTYLYLKDEPCDELTCFVYERRPTDPNSGYTRQVVSMDTGEYRIQKIVFYDRKDSLMKTLLYKDYNQYLDKFWRAGEMRMTNHQTGKSTTLIWKEYKFKTGLTDKDFNKNALKRAR
ncbi:MAG: outer membrane lipoprotein-sorting protein [Proteobacteria bacterium]|nr:outer membrane lipoprotein-sorting protein [Pseudomonadota bacterium]